MSRERKQQVAQQVQENERFLRTITENSLDLIMVADADGVAQYVNPAVERVLGYEREEFVGLTVPELLHPDDYEQVMSAFAWSATNPGVASEYAEGRYRCKDGSWVWIEGIAINLLNDPVVRGIICCGRDINERKRLEDRLRFHSLLVQNMTDIVGVIGVDLTMRYVSPSVEAVLGYRPHELVGTNNDRYVHPDDLTNIKGALAEAFGSSGPTPVVRYRFRHKDGAWVWIEATGTNLLDDPVVGGILFVARDVTERVKSEAEIRRLNETLEERVRERTAQLEALVSKLEANQRMLRESEEMFRSTFELAAVGIAHMALDGRWLRVNEKLCEIVGYAREELLERTYQDITHSDDLGTDLLHLDMMLAGEIDSYSVEKRYVRRDYAQVWVSLTVSLVRHPLGDPNYFISVVEDITERKRAELLLRSLTPREAEVLRLLALGRTNREIAREMQFSVSTVKNHVQHIIIKLDASDRTQAAVRAVELGLIDPEG